MPAPIIMSQAKSDHRRLRLVRQAKRRRDPVTDAPILMLPERVIELNESADAVLACCDGTRSIDQIALSLADEFDGDGEALLQDVRSLADELLERGVVEVVVE